LPSEYGNVSATFNVTDLSLFEVGDDIHLRMNPFKKRRNDRDTTNPSKDTLHGIGGPMTMSKTKRMQQALQGLIVYIKETEFKVA